MGGGVRSQELGVRRGMEALRFDQVLNSDPQISQITQMECI